MNELEWLQAAQCNAGQILEVLRVLSSWEVWHILC